MKKLKRTYTRCAGLTALVLLALLIAGSFADLPISRFLYPGHESSFGQFFAAFGELPAFALLASCGVLLIVRRGEFRPELHMILLAFGVCLIAGSVFLSIHEATDNVPALPTAVALLVTLFVDALAAFAFLFMTRGCQAKTLLRFLCTVIFVCVGIMLLINIIKVPWGRARMRLIYSTGNDTYFTNWWQAGTALKKKLVADGVPVLGVEFRLRGLRHADDPRPDDLPPPARQGKALYGHRRSLDRRRRLYKTAYGRAFPLGRVCFVAADDRPRRARGLAVLLQPPLLWPHLALFLRRSRRQKAACAERKLKKAPRSKGSGSFYVVTPFPAA